MNGVCNNLVDRVPSSYCVNLDTKLRFDRPAQCTTTKLLATRPSALRLTTDSSWSSKSTTPAPASTSPATAPSALPLVALECIRHARRPRLQHLFIAFQDAHSLLRQRDDLTLQPGKFHALPEDDGVIHLVQRRSQLFVGDHLRDNCSNPLFAELKHPRECRYGQGVVVRSIREESPLAKALAACIT